MDMIQRAARIAALAVVLGVLGAAGACTSRQAQQTERDVAAAVAAAGATTPLAQAFTMAQAPGNLTITPDGRRIVSLHQFFNPERVLAEVGANDALVHFPAPGEGALPTGLAAVLGIRSDTAGVLHILDNGNTAKAPPKLVLWDTRAGRHVRTIDLAGATDTNSFVNDLAFDYTRNRLYISDPAGGPNAAIIVVDLASGAARRVLQGHESVVPEQFEFATEGITPTRRRPDGSLEKPRIGVDGIAIDYRHEWVYYAPLHGRTMYRIPAAALAEPAAATSLPARVERYATKPPSDGMVMDEAGNIYLGDLPNNAFGVITAADRQYRELARRDDLKWVDDFEFGADGWLYVVTTQLHRSPELNAGKRAEQPPFRVFRLRPLARGRQGY